MYHVVGSSATIKAARPGGLWLGMNDAGHTGEVKGNTGSVKATIAVNGRAPRLRAANVAPPRTSVGEKMGPDRLQDVASAHPYVEKLEPDPQKPLEEEGLVGRKAPDFTLTSLDGKKVSLSGFRGKPVLLNFWAFW
jgi:hypothetical protein